MGISLGLVGLGAFGAEFAELFRSHPLVDRIGLCDREPDRIARFAERPSFAGKFRPADACTHLDDMLRADFDAVAVITQPWLHAPQAVAAMEAGKSVYSAVPLMKVPDSDEVLDWCDRVVRTAERTGKHYMLGETTCYRPETMYCRRRAAAGDFGRFVHADAQYLHDVDSPGCSLRKVMQQRRSGEAGREWVAARTRYADRGAIDGPMHYPTHSVSGPMFVMGARAEKVSAFGLAGPDGDASFEGELADEVALVRLSNGATMRLAECRWIGHPGEEGFSILGTAAGFREGHWVDRASRRAVPVDEMRDPLPEAVEAAFEEAAGDKGLFAAFGGHGGSHPYLVHEFVAAVAEDRRPAIDAWTAARFMACGAVAHKSALRDGELLDVPDWGDGPR